MSAGQPARAELPVRVPVLIIDDPNDPVAPGAWSEAFEATGRFSAVFTASPAGWFGSSPPPGGNYDLLDSFFDALGVLGEQVDQAPSGDSHWDGGKPIVVGVGVSGWSAQLLALGGRADGLGGPWLTPEERGHLHRERLRRLRDDPQALVAPAETENDPRRLRHPLPTHGNSALAAEAAQAIHAAGLPVVIVESPESSTDHSTAADLAPRFGPLAYLQRVESRQPNALAPVIAGFA